MDPEFWHARWAANQIGFHQQAINEHLQRHWHALGLAPGSRILVPLCGKSRDMLWLREQGHSVVGIEISELAVSAFFTENALPAEVHQENGYTRRSFDDIEILCGDFFRLHTAQTGTLDGCYDRAALVAMPEAQRPRYAAHLAGLLPQASRVLLVTMEYAPAEMNGPPFSVTPREVGGLFSTHFDVTHRDEFDALEANPDFRARGLSRLTEHVWSLARR